MRFVFVIFIVTAFISDGEAQGLQLFNAEDLATLRDIGGHGNGAISVSPDGKWIAFQLQVPDIKNGDFNLSWITLPTSGKAKAVRVADGGEVILNPKKAQIINGDRPPVKAVWSPDSKKFAYTLKRNGQTQIWLSRPNRYGQEQLTHGARDVTEFKWSKDGSKIFYKTGADNKDLINLFSGEEKAGFLYDDRFQLLHRTGKLISAKMCDNDHKKRYIFNLEYDCGQFLWVYDFSSKSEYLAPEDEANVYYSLYNEQLPAFLVGANLVDAVRLWKNGKLYAWLEYENPEIQNGFAAPLRIKAYIDGKAVSCDAEECLRYRFFDDQQFWWDEDGTEIVFTRRAGWNFSEMGVYAWSPFTNEIRTIYQSMDSWLSDCDLKDNKIICIYENLQHPRKIISISLDDGAFETLYDPNPEVSNQQFVKVEKLEWKDKYGNQTHGFLVYPANYNPEETYPLIFVTYSSKGFLRGGVGDEYPIYPLAAEGFFVLSHDRPLDVSIIANEKDPTKAMFDDLYWRKATLSSQEIIIRKLAGRGLIDVNRVAITGLSEGAAQTLFALTHSNMFAVGIASSGGFSYTANYLQNRQTRNQWYSWLNGKPDDPESYWDDLAIGRNIRKLTSPLLFNVSDQELFSAVENVARLQDAGKPVEMYVFPWAHHVKWRPDQRLSIYRRNIQWLKFWLQGKVEAQPVSLNQYKRWRVLCDLQMENNSFEKHSLEEGADKVHMCHAAEQDRE